MHQPIGRYRRSKHVKSATPLNVCCRPVYFRLQTAHSLCKWMKWVWFSPTGLGPICFSGETFVNFKDLIDFLSRTPIAANKPMQYIPFLGDIFLRIKHIACVANNVINSMKHIAQNVARCPSPASSVIITPTHAVCLLLLSGFCI